MKYFIGIDPGSSGAITVIDSDRNIIDIIDMPVRYLKEDEFYIRTGKKKKRKDTRKVIDSEKIYRLLNKYTDSIGFIENVTARSTDGKVSIFTFGSMFQGPKSVLECLGIPYYLVTPQAWQNHFCFDPGDTKDQSFDKASDMASSSHFLGPRGGRKDGRSDSYLIAVYGLEKQDHESDFWVSRYIPSSGHRLAEML